MNAILTFAPAVISPDKLLVELGKIGAVLIIKIDGVGIHTAYRCHPEDAMRVRYLRDSVDRRDDNTTIQWCVKILNLVNAPIGAEINVEIEVPLDLIYGDDLADGFEAGRSVSRAQEFLDELPCILEVGSAEYESRIVLEAIRDRIYTTAQNSNNPLWRSDFVAALENRGRG
jgi:hypothetical protein